jgi:hypothetical protein
MVGEMKKIFFAFIMITLFSSGQAFPCTGIFLNKDNAKLVGRTMDWPTGDGYVSINERGIPSSPIPSTSTVGNIWQILRDLAAASQFP